MIELHFFDTFMERPVVTNPDDLELGVNATFEIRISGRRLYHEELFPIVELRTALVDWMRTCFPRHEAFEFESAESAKTGLVQFHYHDAGWTVDSIHAEYHDETPFPDHVLFSAVEEFANNVDQWVRDNLAVEVSGYELVSA